MKSSREGQARDRFTKEASGSEPADEKVAVQFCSRTIAWLRAAAGQLQFRVRRGAREAHFHKRAVPGEVRWLAKCDGIADTSDWGRDWLKA